MLLIAQALFVLSRGCRFRTCHLGVLHENLKVYRGLGGLAFRDEGLGFRVQDCGLSTRFKACYNHEGPYTKPLSAQLMIGNILRPYIAKVLNPEP